MKKKWFKKRRREFNTKEAENISSYKNNLEKENK